MTQQNLSHGGAVQGKRLADLGVQAYAEVFGFNLVDVDSRIVIPDTQCRDVPNFFVECLQKGARDSAQVVVGHHGRADSCE